jgi:hypothetical protein
LFEYFFLYSTLYILLVILQIKLEHVRISTARTMGRLDENREILIFKKFAQFTDIYTRCDEDIERFYLYDSRRFDSIFIFPLENLVLDRTLQLEKIFRPYQQKLFKTFFANLNGIELYKSNCVPEDPIKISLNFEFSKLDVFYNKTLVTSESSRMKSLLSFCHIFGQLNFNNVIYPPQGVCPYLLEANLALVMIFDEIINSLLYM